MVLRARADHRRAADVDVLDDLVAPRPARHGRREGIEVDDDEVDHADPVRPSGVHVRGEVAPREQPAVDRGVERLDPAVHHLGEAGHLGDVDDRQPRRAQRRRRPPGRHQLDPVPRERVAEVDEPGLVADRKERAGEPDLIHGRGV